MSTKRLITAEDLLKIKVVSDPRLSPNGTRVIFVVKVTDSEKNKYWSHLWMADAQGGDARQFSFGEVNDSVPRWSPDGKQIAFLRTKDKQTQIWMIAADGGEGNPLTKLDEGNIGEPKWSLDGKRLAFTFRPTLPTFTQKARKEREEKGKSTPPRHIKRLHYREDGYGWRDCRQHIWICEAMTGDAKQITDGDEDDFSPVWSPDSQMLAFASNRSADPEEKPYEIDIWIVSTELSSYPVSVSQFTKLLTPVGYKGNCAWSPDGKWIAYTGVESTDDPWVPKHDKIWVVSPSGGEMRCLTPTFDRGIGTLALSDVHSGYGTSQSQWTKDSSRLLFLAADKGNSVLYSIGLNGSEPVPITHGAQVVTSFSVSGNKLAFVVTTPTQLGDVYLIDSLTSQRPRPIHLTDLHSDFHNEVHLAQAEEVWFDSTDGAKVQGWILKPPDFDEKQKYPFILYIHGGPHLQYGNVFFHELQWHAARGYVVMYTNPRGSDNLTEDYMACIRGAWGHKDYQDLMAATDYVEGLPYVGVARMSVCGGSYGGYSTNWLIGHTNRFKCAVTDRSVVSLISMAGQCDYPFKPDGYWKGNTWDLPETLLAQSPLSYMANCTTPVLIIHSEGDWRCPIGQAQELFTALKRLKKCHVEFVWYPSETSHGMSRSGPPDLRLDRLNRYAEWFDKYLK